MHFLLMRGSETQTPGQRKGNDLHGEEGQELVEFAFASSLLFVFIFGVMELCLALFMYSSVAEAAREASRWASVRGTSSTVTSGGTTSCANPNISTCPAQVSDIQQQAEKVPGVSGSNVTVSVLWCNSDGVTNCVTSESNATPGNIVKVKVSYNFASLPFVTRSALTLSSTSEMVIWQ